MCRIARHGRKKTPLMQATFDLERRDPYSLQLVIWGLENLELIGHWAKFQTALLDQANILLTAQPQMVLKLLMNPDDPDWGPGDVELESDDPHEVAGLLIENLLGNLAKVMPAFRD
jgi:hypothetical protein